MKKILSISFFGFAFAFAGLVSAASVTYPTSFKLNVGEDVTVSNYQNMKIHLDSIRVDTGECDSVGTPCPLGNPVNTANPKKAAVITVSTEGGCGPQADSRCLGAPAYSQTITVSEGKTINALALRVTVSNILESSASFSVSVPKVEEDDDNSTTIKPLPPIIKVNAGTMVQGTVNPVDKIVVCAGGSVALMNGETRENCSVCSNGDCKPDSTNESSPRKLGEPISKSNAPIFELKGDETLVSAVKVDASASTTAGYEVRAKRKARLFFLFPVNPELTYSVTASGSTTVSAKPWWNFLAW